MANSTTRAQRRANGQNAPKSIVPAVTVVGAVVPDVPVVPVAKVRKAIRLPRRAMAVQAKSPVPAGRKADPVIKVEFHITMDLAAYQAVHGDVPGDSDLRNEVKARAKAAFLAGMPIGNGIASIK